MPSNAPDGRGAEASNEGGGSVSGGFGTRADGGQGDGSGLSFFDKQRKKLAAEQLAEQQAAAAAAQQQQIDDAVAAALEAQQAEMAAAAAEAAAQADAAALAAQNIAVATNFPGIGQAQLSPGSNSVGSNYGVGDAAQSSSPFDRETQGGIGAFAGMGQTQEQSLMNQLMQEGMVQPNQMVQPGQMGQPTQMPAQSVFIDPDTQRGVGSLNRLM